MINDNIAPKIIGRIIGGFIGSQFGKGSGKIAATIIRTVSGSLLAEESYRSNISNENNYNNVNVEEYQIIEKCQIKYMTRIVERIVGYKNVFYFEGKSYQKITNEPLNYIKIKIIISF